MKKELNLLTEQGGYSFIDDEISQDMTCVPTGYYIEEDEFEYDEFGNKKRKKKSDGEK